MLKFHAEISPFNGECDIVMIGFFGIGGLLLAAIVSEITTDAINDSPPSQTFSQLAHALRPCLQVTIPPTAVFYRRRYIFSKSDETNAI